MNERLVSVKEIKQEDNHHFSIVWSNGQKQLFRLSALQKVCPCAHCVDEHTGRRLTPPHMIKEDVKAITICNVGRYALRIQFTSGCSAGIYSFTMLRQFSEEES